MFYLLSLSPESGLLDAGSIRLVESPSHRKIPGGALNYEPLTALYLDKMRPVYRINLIVALQQEHWLLPRNSNRMINKDGSCQVDKRQQVIMNEWLQVSED